MNKEKKLEEWFEIKKVICERNRNFYINVREVWFAHLGENIGREQNGVGENFSRPVLILKVFGGDLFLCIPLSNSLKKGKYFHEINFLEEPRNALLSQIKTIDKKRLIRKIGKISTTDFQNILEKTKLS